tara:strand:- start:26 stop:211 length:186 start_codon:yes stop_codon:yes gene_type:complete
MKGGRNRNIGEAKENVIDTGKNLIILPTSATKGVTNIALHGVEAASALGEKGVEKTKKRRR